MNAEELANKARKSISKFCIEECHAFCCRKGYLVMKDNEVDIVTQGTRKDLENRQIVTVCKNGGHSMNMGEIDAGCPSLKDHMCVIHKKRKRPDTCRQYPIFIEGNSVKLSSRCLAVKTGLLYPYIYKFKSMGYIINQEGSPYADSNLYNILPDPKEKIPDLKEPDKDNTAEILI